MASGQWASSDRRSELPPDWPARRARCLKAAGGRCTWRLKSKKRCPRPATDADHRWDPENHDDLQALCAEHHKMKTSGEARRARSTIKAKGRRRVETHPAG